MMRKITILFFMLLALTNAVKAQDLHFTVMEKGSGQPIGYAYINTYSTENNKLIATVQTNESGTAIIAPSQYPCKIEIFITGYETYSVLYKEAPQKSNIDILLNKKFGTLNDVVVTGLTSPVKLKDALSNYQVIPRAVIQAQGAVTLNDVLKNQLNMNINNDNVLGANISMQGMQGDKVKILIDGIAVNGRENGNISLSQINLNNVERIEIVQGPMSVVYGSDALGGVINIITKKQQNKFGLSLNTYLETIDKYNFGGNLSIPVNTRNQITLGGGRNFFQGWHNIDVPVSYNGDTINTSRNYLFKPCEQYFGNFAYTYTAPSKFKVSLASDFLKEKISDKGSLVVWDPFLGCYAFDNYYYTTRSNNRLTTEGDIGKSGHWQMQNAYVYYNRIRTQLKKDMVSMQEIPTLGSGDQDTSKFEDITSRGTYNDKLGQIDYTAGYDVNLQYAHSLKIYGKYADIKDYALYTNIAYHIIKEKLTTQVGLRGSYNSKYDAPLVPSANVLLSPNNKLQLRASYANGFRAPSLKELFLDFVDVNHNVQGNPLLKTEKSNHFQLSGSYQAYQSSKNYLQLINTVYYNSVSNGITLVKVNTDPNNNEYKYVNASHLSNLTNTLQADGQLQNIHFQAGYSYRYTFEESGQYAAFSVNELNAMLQYNWKKTGLNFNVFYKYFGTQPYIYYSIDGNASINGTQDAYHMCDASVQKKLFGGLFDITAGVKNIFDIRQPKINGFVTSSAHGGGAAGNLFPRSAFTSITYNIK
ncbi:MAG: TonB-dependent receptor [Bacteroidetes bacterium]|nr:TonB-dependent receptor [Bacteroidota bacterium]